jgi:hypothetical protein
MKAEAEPVPVENRAEHCIEVREIQIIRNGHGRITIGLTLRRTARRISRLKGTFEFIPSAYALEADLRIAAALNITPKPRLGTENRLKGHASFEVSPASVQGPNVAKREISAK